MNELSLFTGIGGGILGSQLLGWRVVCAVEIEPYCREVLLRRQEEGILEPFPIWDDVRTFDGRKWRGKVDIVTGGFPCQPFSVAGKRKGADDARNMWPDTIRIIGEVRPRYALLENVPGLLVSGYMGRILGDISELGYDCRWGIIGADDVGAPHRRKRLWLYLADSAIDRDCRNGRKIQGTEQGTKRNESWESIKSGNLSDTMCGRGSGALAKREGTCSWMEGNFSGDGKKGNVPDSHNQRCDVRGGTERGHGHLSTSIGESEEAVEAGSGREYRAGEVGKNMADTERTGLQGTESTGDSRADGLPAERRCTWWDIDPADLPDAKETMREQSGGTRAGREGFTNDLGGATQSFVGRVANGIPYRVDRLKGIGNAQVPAVVREAWERLRSY